MSKPPMSAWPPSFWPARRNRFSNCRLAHQARRRGRTDCAVRQEDEASASAPDGSPAGGELAERRNLRRVTDQSRRRKQAKRAAAALVAHQTPALRNKRHRRALAAGDDEPAHFGQLLRLADLWGVHASAQLSATARLAWRDDVDGPTSTACAPAFSRQMQCSRNEPCNASTPTTGRALILRLRRDPGTQRGQ